MSDLASELDSACRSAGLSIVGVSIGTPEDKTTWTVQPSALQSAAQPIIDAFNPDASQWSELRRLRNRRLTSCDWTQLGDAQLTGSKVTEWQTYRQVLRDVPENTADPAVVEWPTPPEA